MAFDDRSLRQDDCPKKRVLAQFPDLVCTRICRASDGTVLGYVISQNGHSICEGKSAWDTWRIAESVLKQKL